MPELPEVETTRRGIRPALRGRAVSGFVLREPRLRWQVDVRLVRDLPGQRVVEVRRRAQYLLIELERGTLIAHLGMSGSLRVSGNGMRTIDKKGLEVVVAELRAQGVKV